MRLFYQWRWLYVGALLIGVCATESYGGQLEPALAGRLQQASADEWMPIVIRPVGTMPAGALKKQVTARYRTRAERHMTAVTTLQATANQTQPPILAELNSAYFRDRVDNVRNFWIDNVITAEMTPSAIAEIAARADVEEVFLYPEVTLIKPLAVEGINRPAVDATEVADAQAVEVGLRSIHAPALWDMGYRGQGRLVASLDTGVDGKHTFLKDKWRGNNGYTSKESWFDPVYGSTMPRTFSGSGAVHGTRVMGIMVVNLADYIPGGTTLGVCPECQWISAAAIDIPCPGVNNPLFCGNLFESFQWLADPDGDPNTENDVPDAVANPWGGVENPAFGCSRLFWNAIDNIEAAGAAMIFAAGNWSGLNDFSDRVWNPGNRNSSDVNTLSVGMVNTFADSLNPPIHVQSSRGPSGCDNSTIKPEVVAPGVNVHSINPNDGVDDPSQPGSATGTSFSTPHVAAAAALLRQINPNATVDEIKRALVETARDLGPAGEDNSYGHGIIDLEAAGQWILDNTNIDQPHLFIRDDYFERPSPGGSSEMVIALQNTGMPATGVSVNLISESPNITILDGSASFADMPARNDTANNAGHPFLISVSPNVLSGERFPVRFEMNADGGYKRTWHGAIQIGPVQTAETFTHDAGNFEFTIGASGSFGLQLDGLSPHGDDGVGFLYGADPTQSLFEGAFLVGIDATHVSDNARDEATVPDVDFSVDVGGYLDIKDPGNRYAEETRSAFSDANAENPIGVFIEQRTLVDDDPDADDYCILEYTITNRSGQTISGLRAGLYFDWDFPWTTEDGHVTASLDDGGYLASDGLGFMMHNLKPLYRGLAVVSELGSNSGTTSYRYIDNFSELFDFDGFSGAEKWAAMSEGFVHTNPDSLSDGSNLIASGPFTIAPDQSVTVAFAVIGATTLNDLITSTRHAKEIYNAGSFRISPTVLQFITIEGGDDPDTQTITLTNDTEESIDFTVDAMPIWSNVMPTGGTVAAGAKSTLDVSAMLEERPIGSYPGEIIITGSDDPPTVFSISTTLVVKSESGDGEFPVVPNPFNPKNDKEVTLNFELNAPMTLRANVYDIAGFEVGEVISETNFAAGVNSFTWDGRSSGDDIVAEGVYLCRLYSANRDDYEKIFKIAVRK